MNSYQIPLIEVAGDPRTCGQQHGEAAREQIARSIDFYRQVFERTANLRWEDILNRCTAWEPIVDAYLPDALDEVRGIAEGAGRRFEEILALNGRGELSEGNPFATADEGCSSYALLPEAAGDGHMYCGQNWDWLRGATETVITLRVRQAAKPTILMQVEAGQVGRHGANSAGIGLNANGLGTRFGSGLGVPSPYIRRKVLESTTMHDALDAVFSARQAISSNILLTHRDGFAIDVETTPGRHAWLYPDEGILVHGNHFIAFVPDQVSGTYKPFSVDSLYRVPRIQQALRHCKQATEPAAVREAIAGAMRDHFGAPDSVCNHPHDRRHALDQTQTIASTIVDLTTGEVYLASGTPCSTTYECLAVNLYE